MWPSLIFVVFFGTFQFLLLQNPNPANFYLENPFCVEFWLKWSWRTSLRTSFSDLILTPKSTFWGTTGCVVWRMIANQLFYLYAQSMPDVTDKARAMGTSTLKPLMAYSIAGNSQLSYFHQHTCMPKVCQMPEMPELRPEQWEQAVWSHCWLI